MTSLNEPAFTPDDIEFLCMHTFEAFKAPSHFVDASGAVLFSYTRSNTVNPLQSDFTAVLRNLSEGNEQKNMPIFKTTCFMECFFLIRVQHAGTFLGTFIAGPVIHDTVSAKTLDIMMSELQIPVKFKQDLINYYKNCSVVSYYKLVNLSIFLFYALYRVRLDRYAIIQSNKTIGSVETEIEKGLLSDLNENRLNTALHHTPEYERQMLQLIKDGNSEKLFEFQKRMDGVPGNLSRGNPLRNRKNNFICLVTLVTRAAIEGGLDSELAFTLSDQYIRQLEELDNINAVEELSMEMQHNFCDRVRSVKNCRFSKPVMQCRSYIFKHIYENIRLAELASYVNLNANYLSELFRKEVGMTIHDFIQKEKVDEAKKLLLAGSHSLLDVSMQLNFCNQSHLTRVFRKHANTTPKQFMKQSSMQVPRG